MPGRRSEIARTPRRAPLRRPLSSAPPPALPAPVHDRYADLYQRAPIGYLTLDRGGQVVEANRTALELLRLPSPSVIGVPLAIHVAPAERNTLLCHVVEVLEGRARRTCHVTFGHTPAEGFVGCLESIGVTEPDGRRLCRTALSDVTARLAAEAARAAGLAREQRRREHAEELQRRFDRVAAAAGVLAESLDVEATAASAARVAVPHVASYCAVDLLDAAGRVRRAACHHERGGRDLPLDPYAPRGSALVVRTGEAISFLDPSLGDLLGLAADPAAFAALREAVGAYVSVPLRAHGRVLGAMTFVRAKGWPWEPEDVPLAVEIARHAALALDNARLYREAQEADHRKDEFLAMLGHELRNPLAAVVLAGLMLERHAGASPAAKRTADVIARQGGRLTRLVDDLLEVSRVTRGLIALDRRPVVLGDVVAHAVEAARPLIQERRHAISLRLPPEPLVVEGDAARLEQVVVNLLVNAAKYTPPGGHVEVDVAHAGEEAELCVRDDGAGIAPDKLAAIFVPFTQLDTPIDRTDRGLGVGLTLARQLVELHGGRIEAHSAGLGCGTEMVVHLPLAAAALAPEAPSNGAPAADHLPRHRVLVVEDHPDVAALLEGELSSLGQEVRVAHDGLEAVDAALAFGPELLFIDIGLPGLSGYDVARRLRQEPGLARARMVALTGYGGGETAQRCLEAGFDRHFTKPIDQEVLRRLLG
jgi:signal transduction histidine kinase